MLFREAIAKKLGRDFDDQVVVMIALAYEDMAEHFAELLEHGHGDGHIYVSRHRYEGASFGKRRNFKLEA